MIKDVKRLENQGLVFLYQSVLNEIYSKSGELAKSNEFQVHNIALNFRHIANDKSILDINIPIVFFNYPQEISIASIDFELKDVIKKQDSLKEIYEEQIKKIFFIKSIIEDKFNISLEAFTAYSNSLHRHPGGKNQFFSSTDLNKDEENLGVVYPLKSANNIPNFAGIMYINNDDCKVAHYEYRIVKGDLEDKLLYKRGRCIATVINDVDYVSHMNKLCGVQKDEIILDNSKNNKINKCIKKLLNKINFKPIVDIDSENLKESNDYYADFKKRYGMDYKSFINRPYFY